VDRNERHHNDYDHCGDDRIQIRGEHRSHPQHWNVAVENWVDVESYADHTIATYINLLPRVAHAAAAGLIAATMTVSD
jgi:hypothetical protein